MNLLSFLRSFRLGPFAIFDFALTYLVAYFLWPYLKKIGITISRESLMYLVLPLSILIHYVFGLNTPLTKMVLDPNGHYILKLIIVLMLVLAFIRR
jgi:hypothetical protein